MAELNEITLGCDLSGGGGQERSGVANEFCHETRFIRVGNGHPVARADWLTEARLLGPALGTESISQSDLIIRSFILFRLSRPECDMCMHICHWYLLVPLATTASYIDSATRV